MVESWILAIDLGNGGPKVGVVTLSGEIVATALAPVHVEIGLDGTATQDAVEWWSQLHVAARDAVGRSGLAPGDLHAVGVTGQWGTTVPVDASGEPVGPALLWADTRGGRYSSEVVGGPLSVQGFAPHKVLPFVRTTGGAPTPSGADPTGHSLLLQREFPQEYARTAVLLEPIDYLGMRLTGVVAGTPASMILSWLTDNHIGAEPRYVDDLVRRARRDPHRLPPLRPTRSVLGELLPEVADSIGVRAGVPVVCGVPDLHAAIVGSGAVAPYETHYVVSTTAWFAARVPFKRTDVFHSIATVPGLDPECHLVANNQETGGAALQWLREQVIAPPDGLLGGGSGIGDEGAASPSLAPSFEDLIALAADVPAGSEGVLFTPWLNGERSPVEDKVVRAAFLNMSLRTTRSMMVRSVLEGVAYNARWLFEYYEKFLKRRVPSIRMLGGGAQSELWCQIHADILDRPIEQVANPRDAQLRGVALWARVVLDEISLEQVPALVPVAARFEPGGQQVYRDGYEQYQGLHKRLAPVSKALNLRP